MLNLKFISNAILMLMPSFCIAQTYYIPIGNETEYFINRLEIKTNATTLNYSYIKPYNTKILLKEISAIDSSIKNKSNNFTQLTSIDKSNLQKFISEYKAYQLQPKNVVFKKNNYSIFNINTPSVYCSINPVMQYQQGLDKFNNSNIYIQGIGFNAKGIIGKRIGFQLYFTKNEEKNPYYVNQFTNKFKAIPGFSNYTNVANGSTYRYADVRASINFSLAKKIDIQLGSDRNFLGNGIRSLMLSDFSGNTKFLKINTRIWKLNFENLFMQLKPQFEIVTETRKKKYLRINTLSINATPWLNIGIFDAIVFGREKQFELNYIQPFTFLRAMEQQSGSPDNALFGINLKTNILHKIQCYSQFILDEFKLSEITAKSGWWGNKFGYQLGIKYVDAIGIKNLDVQLEANRIRPFTYTHYDSLANYSNNNMPIAHPLGAGFNEIIFVTRYQPIHKIFIEGKLIYYYQGKDIANENYGNNILINYNNRPIDALTGVKKSYGYEIGSGNKATCTFLNINASYEIKNNVFIDVSFTKRYYQLAIGNNENTSLLSLGCRWNFTKRNFEF